MNSSRPRSNLIHLYDKNGIPILGFNKYVKGWLDKSLKVKEHQPPAAFETLRKGYDLLHEALSKDLDQNNRPRWEAHKLMLSGLTDLISNTNMRSELAERLTADFSTNNSIRSQLSQGMAKNSGENFINIIAYALADALIDQDEILVDKNLPPYLRKLLTLKRGFEGTEIGHKDLELCIEGDLTIFSRSDPTKAIVVSAKTRLKEVFHIGTMWALLFNMLDDKYCHEKWGLKRQLAVPANGIQYVFATADLISEKKEGTQGPDIQIDKPVRNLIGADSSFFNYVFVSKQDRYEVSKSLKVDQGREALIHELGCLLDLIEQIFLLKDLKGTGIPLALASNTIPKQRTWTDLIDQQ